MKGKKIAEEYVHYDAKNMYQCKMYQAKMEHCIPKTSMLHSVPCGFFFIHTDTDAHTQVGHTHLQVRGTFIWRCLARLHSTHILSVEIFVLFRCKLFGLI